MKGTLYICGTPIGNLEDMTFRQIRILKEVDIIAAEDTRHTLKLLNYFEIKTKLTSYHEHNKTHKGLELIEYLNMGKNIALVSDAGMPGISDPGEDLIKLCYENDILVTAVPGPTAVITALVLSGLSTRKYVFEGFLPKDKKKRLQTLNSLQNETRTIIFYESPHHLIKTLILISENLGNRKLTIARELTKKFEEVQLKLVNEHIDYFETNPPRGEFVLILEGKSEAELIETETAKWESISIEEHMDLYKDLQKKEATKLVAKDRGVSKREIYNYLVNKRSDEVD